MKYLMTCRGSYSDYSENWWILNDETLTEGEIKIFFAQAQLHVKNIRTVYDDRFNKILGEHGRKDLMRRGHFSADSPYADEHNVSEELREKLRELENETERHPWLDWESYVEMVSKGRIKQLNHDLRFEYEQEIY